MQTTLRFQVEEEEKQKHIDKDSFPVYDNKFNKNIQFLKLHYPDLFKKVAHSRFDSHSIFFTKHGELNIVQLNSGETLYPLNCDQSQLSHAHDAGLTNYRIGKASNKAPCYHRDQSGLILGTDSIAEGQSCETLVCLGLGLGASSEYIIHSSQYKNVILCEPCWDFFLASLYRIDVSAIAESIHSKGGLLAFDVGEETPISDTLQTIQEHLNLKEFDVYQHLHYEEYDAVTIGLSQGLWGDDLKSFVDNTVMSYKKPSHETPLFCQSIRTELKGANDNASLVSSDLTARFNENLQAFDKFFPDISRAMATYRPQHWLLTVSGQGQYNLFHTEREAFWYTTELSQDIQAAYEAFVESPVQTVPSNNVGGGKLSHYTFYQYAQKVTAIMNRYGKTMKGLPDSVPSMIFLSLGIGLAQEKLIKNHDVEYLYVIEPNIDFFYWAMHFVNWSDILDSFNESEKHINFSIGDDGTYFIEDMKSSMSKLNGFYLFNSFLFIDRKHKNMASNIIEFREELSNLLTLSEHFHYAHYALSHTIENFKSKNCLVNVSHSNNVDGLLPIFVVGNGPSLDSSIEQLKELQENALVVSCGTALYSLWKNGITPDFHAELEQNRCTYSIISQIPDKEYLKKISLLAPCWSHPDTAKLFKNHYAVFITSSGGMQYLSHLKHRFGINPVLPKRPNPTVTNFAVSSLLALGFQNLILIGVDLGFKDITHHHSKDSLYYKDREEKFSYQKSMGRRLMVRGNFTHYVYTKPEFRISAKNLGHTISEGGGGLVKNTSDGAKIEGAEGVQLSDIHFDKSLSKKSFITDYFDKLFSSGLSEELYQELCSLCDVEEVERLFNQLMQLFEELDESFSNLNAVIKQQKKFLYDSYHKGHRVFYGLFVSTFNYVHATLLKVAHSQQEEDQQIAILNETLKELCEMLTLCHDAFKENPLALEDSDTTELVTPS
ncbi:hypothetical protein DFP83_10568 [Idiomarina fontislapidosi]|uniref:DUF115 domain-containing protein n=1 Tax=Idiomarina fontislapidosi TaxID=263723 RepID=A0A432XYH2_9GAMM|nr:6-hydroxymethylpterin diphosphokinase MptE-like protein [Idiomarina fontislapidosi]PYE32761.1 hypothetical protein DFP83_10568 [Idiomarina fontislapidosi]RUO53798.1 hypothetical protein CWE25_07870 [Idiomarina fontislapidosi]